MSTEKWNQSSPATGWLELLSLFVSIFSQAQSINW